MTKDEIICMALEAGWDDHHAQFDTRFQTFAELVASAERERILAICKEGLWDAEGIRYHLDNQERGQA